jgi:CRP-like cAMP-binding protein
MKKKILVIEDNLEVRENLCEILELANFEVAGAENGKLGVEKAIEFLPDLILCDVMMPVLDGFGVLKILLKNPKTSHIPLIFLTAKADKQDVRKGMGLGAEDYITKPFDDTELLEAIEIRLKKAERIQASFEDDDRALKSFFSKDKAEKEIQELIQDREVRNLKSKDTIYLAGQNPRWLYYLEEGQVKIYQTNDIGKELITYIYNPGDFFGFQALLSNSTYPNSTRCTQDTVLRLVPKEDFFKLLFNSRDYAAQFIRMLANRLHDTQQQLIDLAYSSVRKKVASAIVSFLPPGQDEHTLMISREDLASKAGTAKETLIRTLSDFKAEELIEINGQEIKVLDVDKLDSVIW